MEKLSKSQQFWLDYLMEGVNLAKISYDEWIMKANYWPEPSKEYHRDHPDEKDLRMWNEEKQGIIFANGINNNTLKALERKGYIKFLEINSTKPGADRVWTCDKIQILNV